MREIYHGSIKEKILLHLRNYGDTKRASFVTLLAEHYKQNINKATRELLDDGYVSEYRKAPEPGKAKVRYLCLSEKGKSTIRQLEEEHGEMLPNREITNIRRPERKELVMQVFHACKAVGILTDTKEKPSLPDLISPQAPTQDGNRRIMRMQQDGAFYTITEIRKASVELHGDGPLNQTRCIGVIIRGHRLFFVYNMGGKLIYFNSTVEARTRDDVVHLFSVQSGDREPVVRSSVSSCILFANSYGAIAQLFFCRKGGRLPVDENGKLKGIAGEAGLAKWDPTQDRLTMKQLEKLFSDIYLIPVKHATELLGNATQMSAERMDRAASRWIEQQEMLRATGNRNGAQAVEKSSGDDVLVWLDNNLRTLYNVWKGERQVFVIVPMAGPEQGIAQVLGERVNNIQTLTGEVLKTRRYDNYGNPKVK